MSTLKEQPTWEKTIQMLLGDDNPCMECIVRATCTKSFTYNSACEKLAEKLQERIQKRNED